MEIALEDINSAFSTEADTDADIEQLFSNWGEYSVGDILNNKTNSRGFEIIWQRINEIKRKLDIDVASRTVALLELANMIQFLKLGAREAFINSDVKSLLKFFSVNCYLKIPINRFILDLDISREHVNKLLLKAEEISNSFYCNLNIPDDAPYYEKEYFKNYTEGLQEKNIQKVYALVTAVKRGNSFIGFFFLEQLLHFIYEIDIDLFCKCIDSKKEPYEIIVALQWIRKKQIITLQGKRFSNNWLLFELIHQIADSRDPAEGSEVDTICEFLNQIYSTSHDFYIQAIRYFNRFENVNKAVGAHFATLTESEIDAVVNATVDIDRYSHFIDIKTALLDAFSAKASEGKIIHFLFAVYKKWEAYFSEIRLDAEFYAFDLVTTNYANYVFRYILTVYTEEEIINRTDVLVDRILNIDTQWFRDTSRRTTEFYLLLTELDVYSNAVKHSDGESGRTINLEKWQAIFDSTIIRSRYLHRGRGNIELLDRINHNLLKYQNE